MTQLVAPPRSSEVLLVDPHFGRVLLPPELRRSISVPGLRTLKAAEIGELGIFTALQKRPIYECEHDPRDPAHGKRCIARLEPIWLSVTHNERVDVGAVAQDALVFGSGTTRFLIVAVASASLTKAKGDQSLGSTSPNVTTNEFSTIGLSRAAGSLGSYTAPASLGAVFTRRITKAFSVSGTGTAHGAGLFDSATVSGSILYVEDNFSSSAAVINGDTLTVNVDVSN